MNLIERLQREIRLALGEENEEDEFNVSFAKDISDDNIERIRQRKKWTKQGQVVVSDEEMEEIRSGYRNNLFHDEGEEFVTFRTANFCYLIDIIGANSDEPIFIVKKRVQIP